MFVLPVLAVCAFDAKPPYVGNRCRRAASRSKGTQGKFYKPDAVFRLPVYLGEKVEIYLAAKADAKGVELSDLVNDLLKHEIEIIEAMR